jgi:tripeptidyl-peptidase-1
MTLFFNSLFDSLDAIDSSYCGGNDASVNATYPDKNGGYEGAEECGTVKPTHVIASSSGYV